MLTVNQTALKVFEEIVQILGPDSSFGKDDKNKNIVNWQIPYLKESCDLYITYDLENNILDMQEAEVLFSDKDAVYDRDILYKLIGLGKYNKSKVSYHGEEI